MSAEFFPKSRPRNDPPPLEHTLINRRPTPLYALAWTCDHGEFSRRIDIDPFQQRHTLQSRWYRNPERTINRSQRPVPHLGIDGNIYLVVMFNNDVFPDFAARSQNLDDELFVAARDAMFVNDEMEPSLQWYRYPVR